MNKTAITCAAAILAVAIGGALLPRAEARRNPSSET
jgi:hypothetical protein